MVVIIDVRQKVIILCKDIRTAHIDGWQTDSFRIFYSINIAVLVSEASSGFVAQVEARIFITDYFRRVFYIYGSMVGCDDQFESHLLCLLDNFEKRRISKPT